MKQISSIELMHLLKELEFLKDSRIDQIYQPEKNTFLFQFYVSSRGKKILKLILPNILFLTEYKEETETPKDYCIFLRKHIGNARLKEIRQLESERILEFSFETKEKKYYLIAELFSKGNLILCDENHVIINPLEIQKWKDRTIRKGEKYNYPKKKINFLDIDEKKIKEFFKDTERDKLVTLLATDLGLGGTYSEEVCFLAETDKNKIPKDISEKEIKQIINSINKIIVKKNNPRIIYKENQVFDVVPFDLEIYKEDKKESFDDYNKAIEFFLIEHSKLDLKPKTKNEKQIGKMKKIIENQNASIEEITQKIIITKQTAESIYNNYQLINEILTEIRKAREKHSWKEIKERLKGHKLIKDINEKEGKIIIEILKKKKKGTAFLDSHTKVQYNQER